MHNRLLTSLLALHVTTGTVCILREHSPGPVAVCTHVFGKGRKAMVTLNPEPSLAVLYQASTVSKGQLRHAEAA